MGSLVAYLILFGVPIAGGYFIGKRRGRRGWLYGFLSYLGVGILLLLPDLTKSPEQRAREKASRSGDKEVEQAARNVVAAQEHKVLASYGKTVVLYEDGVATPHGWCELSGGLKATVQDAGTLQKYVTSRVTATRVLAFGVFALAAKKQKANAVDTRELYLLVETPEFESLVPCSPDEGPKVRQLATEINNAARHVEALKAERSTRIGAAETVLRLVQDKRAAVGAQETPA